MQTYQIAGLPAYQKFSSLDKVESFLQELAKGNYVIKGMD